MASARKNTAFATLAFALFSPFVARAQQTPQPDVTADTTAKTSHTQDSSPNAQAEATATVKINNAPKSSTPPAKPPAKNPVAKGNNKKSEAKPPPTQNPQLPATKIYVNQKPPVVNVEVHVDAKSDTASPTPAAVAPPPPPPVPVVKAPPPPPPPPPTQVGPSQPANDVSHEITCKEKETAKTGPINSYHKFCVASEYKETDVTVTLGTPHLDSGTTYVPAENLVPPGGWMSLNVKGLTVTGVQIQNKSGSEVHQDVRTGPGWLPVVGGIVRDAGIGFGTAAGGVGLLKDGIAAEGDSIAAQQGKFQPISTTNVSNSQNVATGSTTVSTGPTTVTNTLTGGNNSATLTGGNASATGGAASTTTTVTNSATATGTGNGSATVTNPAPSTAPSNPTPPPSSGGWTQQPGHTQLLFPNFPGKSPLSGGYSLQFDSASRAFVIAKATTKVQDAALAIKPEPETGIARTATVGFPKIYAHLAHAPGG